jgi:hypothetical protein
MCVSNTALILILKSGSQKRFHDIKNNISNGNTMFTDFSFTTYYVKKLCKKDIKGQQKIGDVFKKINNGNDQSSDKF